MAFEWRATGECSALRVRSTNTEFKIVYVFLVQCTALHRTMHCLKRGKKYKDSQTQIKRTLRTAYQVNREKGAYDLNKNKSKEKKMRFYFSAHFFFSSLFAFLCWLHVSDLDCRTAEFRNVANISKPGETFNVCTVTMQTRASICEHIGGTIDR